MEMIRIPIEELGRHVNQYSLGVSYILIVRKYDNDKYKVIDGGIFSGHHQLIRDDVILVCGNLITRYYCNKVEPLEEIVKALTIGGT